MKIVISESQYNKILKEEEEEQGYYEKNFIKILKKFIPDNSVIEFSFPLPYANQGQVDVKIEMSISPRTELNKIAQRPAPDTVKIGYSYVALIYIDVHNAVWKGPGEDFHPIRNNEFNNPKIIIQFVEYVDEKIPKALPLFHKEYVVLTGDKEHKERKIVLGKLPSNS
jgi:hypothetical protein